MKLPGGLCWVTGFAGPFGERAADMEQEDASGLVERVGVG